MLRALCLVVILLAPAAGADEWAPARAGGTILLMRHATAPGTGDPDGFRLGDCATQRNLSEAGRAQARATGAAMRAEGLAITLVATSQWCRARDTAVLLDIGPVEEWPSLNSFFASRGYAEAQTAETLTRLAALPAAAQAVLVTHQVNITAMTGIVPGSGEIIVARLTEGRLVVMGRIAPR